jgi:hypothetical protein
MRHARPVKFSRITHQQNSNVDGKNFLDRPSGHIFGLKRYSLTRRLDHQMQGFGYPARQVPHTADKGQFDNLPGGEVFLHGRKRRLILLGPQMGHFISPPDGGLFFVGKEITISPVVTVE